MHKVFKSRLFAQIRWHTSEQCVCMCHRKLIHRCEPQWKLHHHANSHLIHNVIFVRLCAFVREKWNRPTLRSARYKARERKLKRERETEIESIYVARQSWILFCRIFSCVDYHSQFIFCYYYYILLQFICKICWRQRDENIFYFFFGAWMCECDSFFSSVSFCFSFWFLFFAWFWFAMRICESSIEFLPKKKYTHTHPAWRSEKEKKHKKRRMWTF